MKVLESFFHERLRISLNTDGNVEFGDGGSQFSALQILQSDSDAYRIEFRAWINDVWLDNHRSRLASLLKLRNNLKRYADLTAAARNSALVPLVGSGMSTASGFLMWGDLLREMVKYANISLGDLDAMLKAGQHEEAVDRLLADMGEPLFDEQVEHLLRVNETSQVLGPVRLLPEIFPSLALTTNLDDVLEHVYEMAGKRLQYVLAGPEAERYRKLQSSACLLKLHGDCRRVDGRVLGVSEYNKAYGPGSQSREALSLIYRTKPVLWLGSSLRGDRTMALAEEVAKSDSGMPKHFCFLQQPTDEAEWKEREHFLSKRKIFPIWYDGDHDDCIETLLVGLMDSLGKFKEEA